MNRPILVDVDDVLADFIGKCVAFINVSNDLNLTHDDITGDVMKWCGEQDFALEEFVRSPGFVDDLQVLPGSIEGIETFREMGEKVIFVTSPYGKARTWTYDRTEWLKKHFDADRNDIIFCRDKRFIDGKVLIDDLDRNIYEWETYNKRSGLLFGVLRNQTTNYDLYPFRRVSNWDEIIAFIKDYNEYTQR